MDWNIMTHSRSEIQLIIAADLMKLFIDRQIQHFIAQREANR